MYFISAFVAILGAVGYQYFVKQVPVSINPIVSVIGMYVAVLAIGITLLPFILPEGGILKHIRQLNWIQCSRFARLYSSASGIKIMMSSQ